jgi:seryl-tRNA(Sec) selenium transferase
MAAQLGHAAGVSTAVAVETKSPISAALDEGWPSFGVALTPSDGDTTALDRKLQSARYPVRGRVEGSQLVLDLRTVLPRQDKLIVDSLLGPRAGTSNATAPNDERSNVVDG